MLKAMIVCDSKNVPIWLTKPTQSTLCDMSPILVLCFVLVRGLDVASIWLVAC